MEIKQVKAKNNQSASSSHKKKKWRLATVSPHSLLVWPERGPLPMGVQTSGIEGGVPGHACLLRHEHFSFPVIKLHHWCHPHTRAHCLVCTEIAGAAGIVAHVEQASHRRFD